MRIYSVSDGVKMRKSCAPLTYELNLKVISDLFLLFCLLRPKTSTFEIRKKCFLFYLKSSFHSGDIQTLEFEHLKFFDYIKCLSM